MSEPVKCRCGREPIKGSTFGMYGCQFCGWWATTWDNWNALMSSPSPEERAVVEAAIKWRSHDFAGISDEDCALEAAVDALERARSEGK